MWIIKSIGVGLLAATTVCVSWAALDALKVWFDLVVYPRSWVDVFFGSASGASVVYIWMIED